MPVASLVAPSAPVEDWVCLPDGEYMQEKRKNWLEKIKRSKGKYQGSIDTFFEGAHMVQNVIQKQPRGVMIGAAMGIATATCFSPGLIGSGIILYSLPKITLCKIDTLNVRMQEKDCETVKSLLQ